MRRTIALLVGTLLVSPAVADIGPIGPEFQVNTYTTSDQRAPRVDADPAGNFVVVWSSGSYYRDGADGYRSGVAARRFDAVGSPRGPEFLVNTYTVGPQDAPNVAVAPTGEFTVAWEGGDYYFQQDGSQSGAFLQRFTSGGALLGGERRANTTTPGFQINPVVAATPAGDAVVVWESFPYFGGAGGDGDSAGIFAQRYDAGGIPVGSEFQVNTYTTGRQQSPAVAADPAGGFVVVWQSGSYYGTDGQDGSNSGVFGQRLDAAAAPVGGEFQVNTYTTGRQNTPAVAAQPTGGFVVVWQSGVNYGAGGQDGSNSGVFGQRFDGAGARVGDEFQVNTYTTGVQDQPDVATDAEGDFVVTWRSGLYGVTQDGSGSGVFARHFASTGQAVGAELQVNTFTVDAQRSASVSANGAGSFVVVWETYGYGDAGQDGDGSGIFGQRLRVTGFEPPRTMAGNKLLLRGDPANQRGRRITVRSNDANLGIGLGEGSRDDPTRDGGNLRVRSATFDTSYALPASFWRRLGSAGAGVGWSYRDSTLLAGPITKIVLSGGKLRVSGKGAGLGHNLDVNPDPVEVTLQIGAAGLRQCVRLGGTTTFQPGRRFRATGAPPPPSCDL